MDCKLDCVVAKELFGEVEDKVMEVDSLLLEKVLGYRLGDMQHK